MTTVKHISDLFAKVADLEIMNINGEPTGIVMKVVGTDSKQFRDAEKKTLPYFGKKPSDLSAEELAALAQINKDMVISLIVGWYNNEAFGGEYTPELAKAIFEQEQAKIILEQVEDYAKKRGNFYKTSKE
jgi:hypothetical protein